MLTRTRSTGQKWQSSTSLAWASSVLTVRSSSTPKKSGTPSRAALSCKLRRKNGPAVLQTKDESRRRLKRYYRIVRDESRGLFLLKNNWILLCLGRRGGNCRELDGIRGALRGSPPPFRTGASHQLQKELVFIFKRIRDVDDFAILVMRCKAHRVIASRATIAPELHRNCPHIDIAIAVYNKVARSSFFEIVNFSTFKSS